MASESIKLLRFYRLFLKFLLSTWVLQPYPLLFFFSLLFSYLRAITLIVLLPLLSSCSAVTFSSSCHDLYRIDGKKIKDTATTEIHNSIFIIDGFSDLDYHDAANINEQCRIICDEWDVLGDSTHKRRSGLEVRFLLSFIPNYS